MFFICTINRSKALTPTFVSLRSRSLSVYLMMIPKSMLVLVLFLAVGFLLSMLGTVRSKSRVHKYERIGDTRAYSNDTKNGGTLFSPVVPESAINSYQDSAAMHYALPPQSKQDVTYCVIDGRLVDDTAK